MMANTYKRGNYELPRCTNIISDCTDKSGALVQWGANETVKWIKENIQESWLYYPPKHYAVTEKNLDKARFNYRDVSKKALDVGSEVHKLIEKHLKDENVFDDLVNSNSEVSHAFNAFCEWEKENDLKPIQLEQTVYGDYWAGTLDFYGYFNGKLYVIDWKSSKNHYPEMRYQVAAYRWASRKQCGWLHTHGEGTEPKYKNDVEGCGVLRLDKKTGLPDWKDTSKSYEKDLRIFNKMKDLYFERHPIIARKSGWKE